MICGAKYYHEDGREIKFWDFIKVLIFIYYLSGGYIEGQGGYIEGQRDGLEMSNGDKYEVSGKMSKNMVIVY
jgi:hypothetical protein